MKKRDATISGLRRPSTPTLPLKRGGHSARPADSSPARLHQFPVNVKEGLMAAPSAHCGPESKRRHVRSRRPILRSKDLQIRSSYKERDRQRQERELREGMETIARA
jgi:hypothetical protein